MPPTEVYRPSELVGMNVRKWRERRSWSQQRLVDRLDELLTESPPWAERLYEARQEDPTRPKDSRERNPEVKTAGSTWNQPKIARLEAGRLQKVGVEEVFELALALDVSPLQLMAHAQGSDGEQLRIRFAPTLSKWPHEVRQWIRGVNPLLGTGDYRNDDEAAIGRRFYLLESQPYSEWDQLVKAGEYAKRMAGVAMALSPGPGEAGEEEHPVGE
jgi:transcriptional regulator with XRE-family HTH domain